MIFSLWTPNSTKCLSDLSAFLHLCHKLGVPIEDENTVLPTTIITIYDIEVDSNKLECPLPQDKIDKVHRVLQSAYHKKKMILRELQSLIGLWNFACLVVRPGRAFLRRLIDLTKNVSNPFHYIKLTCEARADIQPWKSFIEMEHHSWQFVFLYVTLHHRSYHQVFQMYVILLMFCLKNIIAPLPFYHTCQH